MFGPPLALGADVSVMAATKYLSGHSDVVMGAVTTTAEAWPALVVAFDSTARRFSPAGSTCVNKPD